MEQGREGVIAARLLPAAAVIAAAAAIAVLSVSLGRPLTDEHAFRQSQTAISVYWMLHGGGWLDYWTPVFGPDSAAPFEFPLFQWIVAGLVRASGLSIDDAGRIVSFAWLLVGIIPATYLLRAYGTPRAALAAYPALLLASPVYLFWGRAFLIETQALTLCLAGLAWYHRWLHSGRPSDLALAAIASAAGALTKITTLLPFLMLSGLMLAPGLWRERRSSRWLAMGAAWGTAYALPVALAVAWTHHADRVKGLNPIATWFRSDRAGMVAWNFGTLQQRLSPALPQALVRSDSDTFGLAGTIVSVSLLAALFMARRQWREPWFGAMAASIAAYLLPFLVFTNLHIQHDYYQSANAAFLILAAAFAVGALHRHRPLAAGAITLALMASQLAGFLHDRAPLMRYGLSTGDYRLALRVKALTQPGSMLLVYDTEWSPLVAYYAERQAIMETTIPPIAETRARARDLERTLGGRPLGAVVICPNRVTFDPALHATLERLVRPMRAEMVAGCSIFVPKPAARLPA